jgi:hypothetical protein
VIVRLALLVLLAGLLPPSAVTSKKLIETGWDEPDPAFMRSHVAQMEASPFDGCVYHLKFQDGARQENFTWKAWGRRAFRRDDLQAGVDDLRATEFRRFQHNFLRFNVTPGDVDWFDDFEAIRGTARLAAWAAAQGGSKGIWFDTETYEGKIFDYRKQRHASRKSYEAYAAQARLRGRQIMEAFQEGHPDLTVFLTLAYSWTWREMRLARAPSSELSYGLLPPFLDGMVEAARGRARLIDGYELSYPIRSLAGFTRAYREIHHGTLPIVADPVKYKRVFSAAFALWMDYDWKKFGWSEQRTERNYHSPRSFERLLRKALQTTDEYVWVYSESPRWWTAKGGPERLPRDYVEAVRRGRGTRPAQAERSPRANE